MSEYIKQFFEADNNKAEELMKKYPISIPISEVAKLLGMTPKTVRASIEAGRLGGVAWRSHDASNMGFTISTPLFFRWYLNYKQ